MMPHHRKILRLALVCAILYLPARTAWAQDIQHYRATVSGLNTTLQEKQLLEHFSTSDPLGTFRVDRSAGLLVLKTVHELDRHQVEYQLAQFQVGLVAFEEVGGVQKAYTRGERVPRLADMPLYIDTGDPDRDNQRYDAYKAAWVAAHPDQYEELTAPRPTNDGNAE